jgi:signal transduction histidine kinase
MADTQAVLAPEAPVAGRFVPGLARLPLYLALWLIPGLIAAGQTLFWYGSDTTLGQALLWNLPQWLYWGLVTPIIIGLGRGFRLEAETWQRSLAVHLIATVVLSFGHVAVIWATGYLTGQKFYVQNPASMVFVKTAVKGIIPDLICYWGVLAASYAFEYHRRFRERAVAAAQLETRLTLAQLEALKMQLHPHFLFNTLHAIAVLVRKGDTQESVRMITGLSDLLRLALDTVGQQTVPLKQEMDFVGRYLEIEKIRFQDRLRVTTDIAHDTLDASVPNLLLQPIVENAVRHGIAAKAAAGELEISSRRRDDRLVITVRDDGAGLRAGWKPGLGLRNVRSRLEQLYNGGHVMQLAEDPRGGTIVTVEIPFRHE